MPDPIDRDARPDSRPRATQTKTPERAQSADPDAGAGIGQDSPIPVYSVPFVPGKIYTKDDYLDALRDNGFTIVAVGERFTKQTTKGDDVIDLGVGAGYASVVPVTVRLPDGTVELDYVLKYADPSGRLAAPAARSSAPDMPPELLALLGPEDLAAMGIALDEPEKKSDDGLVSITDSLGVQDNVIEAFQPEAIALQAVVAHDLPNVIKSDALIAISAREPDQPEGPNASDADPKASSSQPRFVATLNPRFAGGEDLNIALDKGLVSKEAAMDVIFACVLGLHEKEHRNADLQVSTFMVRPGEGRSVEAFIIIDPQMVIPNQSKELNHTAAVQILSYLGEIATRPGESSTPLMERPPGEQIALLLQALDYARRDESNELKLGPDDELGKQGFAKLLQSAEFGEWLKYLPVARAAEIVKGIDPSYGMSERGITVAMLHAELIHTVEHFAAAHTAIDGVRGLLEAAGRPARSKFVKLQLDPDASDEVNADRLIAGLRSNAGFQHLAQVRGQDALEDAIRALITDEGAAKVTAMQLRKLFDEWDLVGG